MKTITAKFKAILGIIKSEKFFCSSVTLEKGTHFINTTYNGFTGQQAHGLNTLVAASWASNNKLLSEIEKQKSVVIEANKILSNTLTK